MRERPPGWYPDASVPGHERWWDGGTWSHVTRPAPAAGGPPAPVRPNRPAPNPSGPPPGQVPGQGPGQPPWGAPGLPGGVGGRPARAVTTPDGLPLAGPGARLVARIIDGVLVLVLTLVIGFPLVRDMLDVVVAFSDTIQQAAREGRTADPFALASDPRYSSAATGLAFIQLGLSGLYHTSMIALRGATIGKLVMGLRVRPWDADGRPTWGQAALRWVTTDIGSVIPVVGLAYSLLDKIWLLRDPRRQCLHDKLPKTTVIRSR